MRYKKVVSTQTFFGNVIRIPSFPLSPITMPRRRHRSESKIFYEPVTRVFNKKTTMTTN